MARKTHVEGIRITKVGLAYILLALVVGVAAANTGNNALYIVEALVLSVLVFSGITSRRNVARLDVTLELPAEVHANEPFTAQLQLRNRDRFLARRLITVSGLADGETLLMPYLEPRGETTGDVQALVARRGVYSVPHLHLSSVFPFGFFRKGLRIDQEAEMLVFPELFRTSSRVPGHEATVGERPSRRRGQGQELFNLRRFQAGDDRRGVHWKQSARIGELVFMEREAVSGRRLSIVLDNAIGELAEESDRQRFERLVSEAATAAHEALAEGYAVELRTRDLHLAPAAGGHQRYRVMCALALVAPVARTGERLGSSDPRIPQLRLALDLSGRPSTGIGAGSSAA